MARNQHAGPSTLRNRNRVTNKTRLKVIKESIDADPIVLDEDEEKARVVSTAGVDAEDANEHHLQAVLSAAATRHYTSSRSTRGAEKEPAPAAYIPTPDSTGKVDNYEELYAPNKWRDPVTYVKSSDSVEESTSFALSNGFIYYMDERDKEWLDKNNEEARGEGPSKRVSRKGKESETISMSEDEFELVMAMFEKITHEKVEFLHHNFRDVPPFTLYEETFALPLPRTTFALFEAPSWIPVPTQLLRLARIVYPHWSVRRTDRDGHPIIPAVNLDESDTKNESYICFRRRESKAVRKTRAQQATFSDKMIRLQSELTTAMELAKGVCQREALKRHAALEGKGMWERRFAMVDVKRKCPMLGTKEDDELFQDRERVPKKIKADTPGRIPIKLRTTRESGDYGSPVTTEPVMKPKDRTAMIQAQIDEDMAKRKDHRWEDVADNPYQPLPQPYPSRQFKYISPARGNSAETVASVAPERSRACRLRLGRGGRRHLDRRLPGLRRLPPRRTRSSDTEADDTSDLERQWRYDEDDEPIVGPNGPEEHDRVLVDDHAARYATYSYTLLTEEDQVTMVPDPTMTIYGPDGRLQPHTTFRPTPSQLAPRMPRLAPPPGVVARHSGSVTPQMSVSGSSPAQQQQQRPMPPPHAVLQARSSSIGAARSSSTPTVPPMQSNATPPQSQSSPATANGNGHHGQINGDQEVKPPAAATVAPMIHSQSEAAQSDSQVVSTSSVSPMRPKSQTPTMTAIPNGFTIPAVNSYSTHMANGASFPAVRPNGMSQHLLKSAFASLTPGVDNSLQMNGTHISMRSPANSYAGHALASVPYPSNQIAVRQMQWITSQQRTSSVNLADATNMDAGVALSSPVPGAPSRTPSINGTRSLPMSRRVSSPALAQAMAAGQGRASPVNARLPPHSPNLLSTGLVGTQPQQSPPRPPSHMPSPSMQARQIVGSSGF
ncbi:enhancer of polycomb-like-domain-containing protein [Cytidiella melzeri]|nr:enhancer of polycomb-like-domain-containing protein [Cytidiella melzeri]